ncbi:hypothetical protein BH23BAC4_BH23BAC4_06190 [soil metagenome]
MRFPLNRLFFFAAFLVFAGCGSSLRLEQTNPEGIASRIGSAPDCHVDLACDVARPWREASRSVARHLFDPAVHAGCAGVFINNTRHDGRVLFLTARHCMGRNEVFTRGQVIPSRHFQVNFRAATCGGEPAPSSTITSSYRVLTFDDRPAPEGADFMLLELLDVSFRDLYNHGVIMAGWQLDAPAQGPAAVIGFPTGDVAKAAVADRAPAPDGASWQVPISHGGITAGYSGGPLLDREGRILGHATSAGPTGCGGAIVRIERLGAIWEQGDVGQRLRDFLDPRRTGTRSLGPMVPWTGRARR